MQLNNRPYSHAIGKSGNGKNLWKNNVSSKIKVQFLESPKQTNMGNHNF